MLALLLGVSVGPDDNVTMNDAASWDSMKHIEIIMTIEQHFQISFSPEDIPGLTSQALLLAKIKELQSHA